MARKKTEPVKITFVGETETVTMDLITMNESKPEHSPLGASNCERWWNCPGSVHLISQVPNQNRSSEDAARGTCVHKMAEIKLRDKLNGTHEWSYYEGSKISADGFSFRVDQKMLDGMNLYVDYVWNLYKSKPGNTLWVEKEAKVSETMWGRSDAVVLIPFESVNAIDYKNGYNEVDVVGNKQGLYYLLGVFLGLPRHVRDELSFATVTIIQPNGASGQAIKTWTIPIDELHTFHTQLNEAETRTFMKNKPALKAGNWCRWCPAQPVCDAYKANMMQALPTLDFAAVPAAQATAKLPAPINLTAVQLATFLHEIKPNMDNYFDVMEQYAHSICENGTAEQKAEMQKAGFTIKDSLSNRDWIDESQAAQALITQAKLHTSCDIYKPKVLRSPKQIEDELKAAKIDFDLSTYYDRKVKGTALSWKKPAPCTDYITTINKEI